MRYAKWLVGAALVLGSCVAVAGNAVDEKFLGLTEQSLKAQLPAVVKLDKPVWGPRRERGTYVLRDALLYGQPFQVVFYFKDGRIGRIAQRQSYPLAGCAAAYAALLANLEATYGAEPRSNVQAEAAQGADATQSNAWSWAAFNVHLYKIQDAQHCDLLAVFLPHTEMDASQL